MMLGSRFSVGAPIPAAIPTPLHNEIRAIEAGLDESEASTLRWTLTWLEGRPVMTLDNGIQVGDAPHPETSD